MVEDDGRRRMAEMREKDERRLTDQWGSSTGVGLDEARKRDVVEVRGAHLRQAAAHRDAMSELKRNASWRTRWGQSRQHLGADCARYHV
eukprot:868515-Rhodomonas_salina.4